MSKIFQKFLSFIQRSSRKYYGYFHENEESSSSLYSINDTFLSSSGHEQDERRYLWKLNMRCLLLAW